MKTIHPAIAEHVMEENERLREALKFAFVTMSVTAKSERLAEVERRALLVEAARIEAALSQQAEPTDTYTAVDMATAVAQGFRDGQAAVEPAAAQDEREAFEVAHALRALAEQFKEAWPEHDGKYDFLVGAGSRIARAAPIAQTAPQPEQSGWISVEGCEP